MGEIEFMDLLYARYSNPMELMGIYINSGQFGEFVSEIIALDNKRKREEARKEEDNKLWTAYLFSMSDKSFYEWKKELRGQQEKETVTYSMTDIQVENAKNNARGILKRISPA